MKKEYPTGPVADGRYDNIPIHYALKLDDIAMSEIYDFDLDPEGGTVKIIPVPANNGDVNQLQLSGEIIFVVTSIKFKSDVAIADISHFRQKWDTGGSYLYPAGVLYE